MADVSSRTAAPEQGSYKSKLTQQSATDELSAPDQAATKMKLAPSQDAGTPPMTLGVADAPAGPSDVQTSSKPIDIKTSGGRADSTDDVVSPHSRGNVWSPKGNTQSPIDARFSFKHSKSGRQGSAQLDYVLPEGAEVVPQPPHVDDHDDEGDAGATAGNKSWAPEGSTQTFIDGRHKFSGDRQGSTTHEDYELPEGSTVVVQPQHVDHPHGGDTAAAAAGLSVKTGQTADTLEADDVKSPHSRGQLWSPKGNTQSPIDARFSFKRSVSGRHSAKLDYVLPEGAVVVHQPQHVDDHEDDDAVAAAAAGPAVSGDKANAGPAADSGGSRVGGFSAPKPPAESQKPMSHKLSDDKLTESPTPDSKSQSPLAAAADSIASSAAAAVKPVVAAVGQLKSAVLGSGAEKSEGAGEEEEEKSEGVKIAESEFVEIEGGDKVLAAAVL